MIKASRNRYGVWFDLGQGSSANVEVHYFGVRLRISDDNYAAEMSPADAVHLLRAMLREIAGPSIDDVREVWNCHCATCIYDTDHGYCAQPWHVRVPHPESGSLIFGGNTERDALQAAYDAGVARAAAAVPPT